MPTTNTNTNEPNINDVRKPKMALFSPSLHLEHPELTLDFQSPNGTASLQANIFLGSTPYTPEETRFMLEYQDCLRVGLLSSDRHALHARLDDKGQVFTTPFNLTHYAHSLKRREIFLQVRDASGEFGSRLKSAVYEDDITDRTALFESVSCKRVNQVITLKPKA